jgi:hypothetical protein
MAQLLAWTRLEPSASKGAIVPDSAIAVECRGGGCLIIGFRGATGTAGIVFLLLAAIVWLALPFGHPVYAVVIPPLSSQESCTQSFAPENRVTRA